VGDDKLLDGHKQNSTRNGFLVALDGVCDYTASDYFFLLSCVFPNIHTNIPWKIFFVSLFSAVRVSSLAFSSLLFETYPPFGFAFFL